MDIVEEDSPNVTRETDEEKTEESFTSTENFSYSSIESLSLHLVPSLGLLSGLWIIPFCFGFNLIDHPFHTLRISAIFQFLSSFILYTVMSVKLKRCPTVFQATWRSIITLPTGAIVAIVTAIIFGAPLDFAQSGKTAYWALLASSLVALPAGIVFGQSWFDWQRLFAFTRPNGLLEYSICIPAHGAVVGAWFGAWPMPLDWERPWQEWPICVSYGMAVGFIIGEILSLILVVLYGRNRRYKQD